MKKAITLKKKEDSHVLPFDKSGASNLHQDLKTSDESEALHGGRCNVLRSYP